MVGRRARSVDRRQVGEPGVERGQPGPRRSRSAASKAASSASRRSIRVAALRPRLLGDALALGGVGLPPLVEQRPAAARARPRGARRPPIAVASSATRALDLAARRARGGRSPRCIAATDRASAGLDLRLAVRPVPPATAASSLLDRRDLLVETGLGVGHVLAPAGERGVALVGQVALVPDPARLVDASIASARRAASSAAPGVAPAATRAVAVSAISRSTCACAARAAPLPRGRSRFRRGQPGSATSAEQPAVVGTLEVAQAIVDALPFARLPGGPLERFQARLELGQQVGDAGGCWPRSRPGCARPRPPCSRRPVRSAACSKSPRRSSARWLSAASTSPWPTTVWLWPSEAVSWVDVLEADLAAVDQVLVLAAAEGAAGDGDLGELDRQPAGAVVEGDGDLGHPGRGLAVAAGEDDVLGLLAAQARRGSARRAPSGRASAMFDLPLPFGPTIAVMPGSKTEDGPAGEALEPVQLEPGQAGRRGAHGRHRRLPPAPFPSQGEESATRSP